MLSTKNLPEESGSFIKKTLSPGNHIVRLYDIKLEPGFSAGQLVLTLYVVGPDMGPEFDGFLMDPNNPNGAKFAGQVGRVKHGYYAFEDGTTKTGKAVNRDQSILQAIDRLATALGVREKVSEINANTIEQFVTLAKPHLVNGSLLEMCIAGKPYTNKGGYKDYGLFMPYAKDKKYPYATAGAANSNVIVFDPATHILKEKAAQAVESFEPANNDFDF